MKKLILTIILITIIHTTTNSQSGWVLQNPNSITAGLQGVEFINSTTGWVVGSGGMILKTSDNGKSWIQQSISTINELCGISFSDPNNGIAVAWDGIFKTTNGGTKWTLLKSDPACSLNSLSFTDSNHGTIAACLGKIMRTNDGGKTWTNQISGTGLDLFAVSFADSNLGIIAGSSGITFKLINV